MADKTYYILEHKTNHRRTVGSLAGSYWLLIGVGHSYHDSEIQKQYLIVGSIDITKDTGD